MAKDGKKTRERVKVYECGRKREKALEEELMKYARKRKCQQKAECKTVSSLKYREQNQ